MVRLGWVRFGKLTLDFSLVWLDFVWLIPLMKKMSEKILVGNEHQWKRPSGEKTDGEMI